MSPCKQASKQVETAAVTQNSTHLSASFPQQHSEGASSSPPALQATLSGTLPGPLVLTKELVRSPRDPVQTCPPPTLTKTGTHSFQAARPHAISGMPGGPSKAPLIGCSQARQSGTPTPWLQRHAHNRPPPHATPTQTHARPGAPRPRPLLAQPRCRGTRCLLQARLCCRCSSGRRPGWGAAGSCAGTGRGAPPAV